MFKDLLDVCCCLLDVYSLLNSCLAMFFGCLLVFIISIPRKNNLSLLGGN